jgi:hypothetical protein
MPRAVPGLSGVSPVVFSFGKGDLTQGEEGGGLFVSELGAVEIFCHACMLNIIQERCATRQARLVVTGVGGGRGQKS